MSTKTFKWGVWQDFDGTDYVHKIPSDEQSILQVKLRNGDIYPVTEQNENGGRCECCGAFDLYDTSGEKHDAVVAYRMLEELDL